MGKKSNKQKKTTYHPMVSVCTPTFNRRPFIPYIIACFKSQDYPKDKIEWIVVDDGTDKVKDLFADVKNVKYYEFDEKMSLGKKRNFMHTKAKGDIIVYMDDDDYYPPCRVSHAVDKLLTNPEAMCAGSSEIYIYFKHIKQMYQFGPYGPTHATAGTFAFRRELLKDTAYEDHAALAEEKAFLKNYTVPFVQLDPMKTILVFSHEHNTFDKRKLLINPHPQFVRTSAKTVSMFVKSAEIKKYFMEDIDKALENYKAGKPEMKPDVMKQIEEIEESRRKEAENMNNQHTGIVIQEPGQMAKNLTRDETVRFMQNQQHQLQEMTNQIQKLTQENRYLNGIIQNYIQNNKKSLDDSNINNIISQINS